MEKNGEERKKRRPKGTGCLVKRGKFWYAKWTANGEAHVRSTGIPVDGEDADERSTNLKKAEEALMDFTEPLRLRHREDAIALLMRQIQTTEERIRDAMEKTVSKPTLGGMAALFEESARRPDCSSGMLARYKSILDAYAEFAGEETPVADVGDAEAEEYSRHLAKTWSANTHNKHVNALDLAWRTCGKSAGIQDGKNPWAEITRKKLDTHVRRVLTKKETDEMLKKAKGELRTLVAVCLFTGLRMGDACRFAWEDVKGRAVYVVTAKRGKKVAIPIHPTLSRIIGARKGKTGYVMPRMARTYGNDARGASNVSKAVQKLMRKCGIKTSVKASNGRHRPDASAHSLRHTFVTRAIEAGVPPHVVQAIVGHSSAAMTEHYTHLSDKAVLAAFRKVK